MGKSQSGLEALGSCELERCFEAEDMSFHIALESDVECILGHSSTPHAGGDEGLSIVQPAVKF